MRSGLSKCDFHYILPDQVTYVIVDASSVLWFLECGGVAGFSAAEGGAGLSAASHEADATFLLGILNVNEKVRM